MFFHSVEFYVILFVSAALVIGVIAIPRGAAAVKEILVGSRLEPEGDGDDEASIEIECDNMGNVRLIRHGLSGIAMDGAVSAKVEVKGERITVYERLTRGRDAESPAGSAVFTLDFLGSQRYYLRYESEATSTAATLAFRNVAGYHAGPAQLIVNS